MTAFNVDHFIARTIQDAMAQATAQHWLRRAEEFEWAARPREDDFLGRASDADREARTARLTAKAEACRARADVCELDENEQQMVLEFVHVALVAARTVPGEVAA